MIEVTLRVEAYDDEATSSWGGESAEYFIGEANDKLAHIIPFGKIFPVLMDDSLAALTKREGKEPVRLMRNLFITVYYWTEGRRWKAEVMGEGRIDMRHQAERILALQPIDKFVDMLLDEAMHDYDEKLVVHLANTCQEVAEEE